MEEFETLSRLHDDIKDHKKKYSSKILLTFSNKPNHKFNKNISDIEGRINLSSTSICTYTLIQYADLWNDEELIQFDERKEYWNYIIGVLKNKHPSGVPEVETPDEFTILNVLPLLKKIQTCTFGEKSTDNDTVILDIIESLCNQFTINEFCREENPHPFIFFKFLMILEEWEDKFIKGMEKKCSHYRSCMRKGVKNKKDIPFITQLASNNTGVKEALEAIREKIYTKGKHELYRQMTLRFANDETLFDVKRLVYSLLIVSKRSKYSNSMVFRKALDIIFDAQLSNGLLPICHTVNNDFTILRDKIKPMEVTATPNLLSFECYNDMLSDLNIRNELIKYQGKLRLAIDWAERQLRKEPGESGTERLLGWYPEYECSHMPESWVSAHILLFFKKYCEWLSQQTNALASTYLGAIEIRNENLEICDSYNLSDSIALMSDPKTNYNSVLLFGPPGTGKSTAGKCLAKKLNWKYIEISPASFLKDGEDKVVFAASEIFRKLSRVSEAVILFDEADELIKDRKNDRPAWILTALLPLLAELRDKKKIKFILATNKLLDIDEAAYRPGRVDLVLPMGGVSWRYRIQLLQKTLRKAKEEVRIEAFKQILATNEPKTPEEIKNWNQHTLTGDNTNRYLRCYLERTNYVPQRDLQGLLKTIFEKDTFAEVISDDLFKVFFTDLKKDAYKCYEEPRLDKFHNQELTLDSYMQKIRFTKEAKKIETINDNIIPKIPKP